MDHLNIDPEYSSSILSTLWNFQTSYLRTAEFVKTFRFPCTDMVDRSRRNGQMVVLTVLLHWTSGNLALILEITARYALIITYFPR